LEFKNIILEDKLSNKFKNGHENFSGVRVSMILKLLAGVSLNHDDGSKIHREILSGKKCS
jgi:hypothetical protein